MGLCRRKKMVGGSWGSSSVSVLVKCCGMLPGSHPLNAGSCIPASVAKSQPVGTAVVIATGSWLAKLSALQPLVNVNKDRKRTNDTVRKKKIRHFIALPVGLFG
jgi:hypothetical protein